MNVLAHGVDMVECARLREAIDRHGERFLRRVFTEVELTYCLGKAREIEHLAGRFAAKEAVLKVLGTGWRGGVRWTDVEIRNESSGQPKIRLSGTCRRLAAEMGLAAVLISISHVSTHAIASAIGCGPAAEGASN